MSIRKAVNSNLINARLPQLIHRSFHISPIFQERVNGEEPHQFSKKYESMPECQKKECVIETPRVDDNHPYTYKIAKDQIGSYVLCPPLPPSPPQPFCCDDLPKQRPPKRPRKPFTPVVSQKPDTKSPGLGCHQQVEVQKDEKCPKLGFPNCKAPQYPKKCKAAFERPICKRIPNPSKSLSEWFTPPKPTRRTDCSCWESKKLCFKNDDALVRQSK